MSRNISTLHFIVRIFSTRRFLVTLNLISMFQKMSGYQPVKPKNRFCFKFEAQSRKINEKGTANDH